MFICVRSPKRRNTAEKKRSTMHPLVRFFCSTARHPKTLAQLIETDVVVLRSSLVFSDFLPLKIANILFLQEMHTDTKNHTQRMSGWKDQAFFSHHSNMSAGVSTLLSEDIREQPINAAEIIPGRMQRVDQSPHSLPSSD